MYSTCIFCNTSLGANEIIEAFPVGRRLAFDPARGRLWVVCRKCQRWNLSPLEQRWEAFEECERRFRDTKLRMSTEHIGLARLSEGLELVRIGAPLRPEFAAWRYGDQFGRRRKRTMLYTGAAFAAGAGLWAGFMVAGLGYSIGISLAQMAHSFLPRARFRSDSGRQFTVLERHLPTIQLLRHPRQERWALRIGYMGSNHDFFGAEAERITGILLPALNRTSGSAAELDSAVRLLTNAASPDSFVETAMKRVSDTKKSFYKKGALISTPASYRLALEMALHEEQERRALEGELHLLETAWREAEEIAAIADNMFVPSEHEELIERYRGGAPPRPRPPAG